MKAIVGGLLPRGLIGVTVLAVSLGVVACSPSGPPASRSLTTEESQLLAIARFRNFDAGSRSVTFEVTDAGHAIAFDGWCDYRTGTGYGLLLDGGTPNTLIMWRDATLAIHAPGGPTAPLPPPDAGSSLGATWLAATMDPAASALHAALLFVAELGSDRPENPLLLQQGGALWLRDDSIDGVPVTVFAGPTGLAPSPSTSLESSRVRYWVDATGLLHRVEVRLGAQWVTIDLGPADGVALDYDVAAATG